MTAGPAGMSGRSKAVPAFDVNIIYSNSVSGKIFKVYVNCFSYSYSLLIFHDISIIIHIPSLPVLGGVDLVIPSDVSVANNGRLSVGETASLTVDGVSRGAVISLTLENVSASSTVQASFQAERSPVTDADGDGTTNTGQHIILLSCFSLYDPNIRGCGYYDHSRCKHRCQYL